MNESPARRILLDEMLSSVIAQHLRERGWDVTAIVEIIGMPGTPDEEVLAFASRENRVVVTVNVRDFVILDRLWREQGRLHSGISYLDSHAFRQDNSFMGHVQGALDSALRSGNLPDPGSCRFIAP